MIGLIFGETDFPNQILKKIKNKKKYLIIDLSREKLLEKIEILTQFLLDSLVKLLKS